MKYRYIFLSYSMLFLLGTTWLLINVSGLTISLRNDNIYNEKTYFSNDITINESEFYRRFNKLEKSDSEYLKKINILVNNAMAHYWPNNISKIEEYNIRIPPNENLILNILSYIFPDKFLKYEFCNHRKALERGVGICSQQAIVLTGFLREDKINTKILFLSGHVVSIVETENEYFILDPDYGVFIEENITTLENNPKILKKYYLSEGYDNQTIENLAKIFGESENFIIDFDVFCGEKRFFEDISYILKWLFPILFCIPLLFVVTRRTFFY